MDELTRIALVGTSKAPGVVLAHEEAADAGITSLKDVSLEDQILMRAGARSLYSQAGFRPLMGIKPLESPPPETERLIPPTAERLLVRAWDTQSVPLIQQLLRDTQRHQVILPPSLLTRGLNERDAETRLLVRPLLGHRGRWLAALNPAWSRVLDDDSLSPDDLQRTRERWDESSLVEQIKALRAIRQGSPAVARDLLTTTFSNATADARSRLLETLGTGLSNDDEEFLERCLDDRAASVRDAAASLLVKIPQSACSLSMLQRADAMLTIETKGILKKKQRILVAPPKEISKDDERDGLPKKPPGKGGQRAFWTTAILSRVPLDHWTTRFALSPSALITAVEADEYRDDVLRGWIAAACETPGGAPCSGEWAQALVDASLAAKLSTSIDQLRALIAALPPTAAAKSLEQLIFGEGLSKSPGAASELLDAIPSPWSSEFGLIFLRRLGGGKDWSDPKTEWLIRSFLSVAEVGLPIEMLPEISKFVAWEAREDHAMSVAVRQALLTLEDRVRLRDEFQKSLTR